MAWVPLTDLEFTPMFIIPGIEGEHPIDFFPEGMITINEDGSITLDFDYEPQEFDQLSIAFLANEDNAEYQQYRLSIPELDILAPLSRYTTGNYVIAFDFPNCELTREDEEGNYDIATPPVQEGEVAETLTDQAFGVGIQFMGTS